MYNSLELGLKYIRYYITASNGKGHGIHSPFVYQFVEKVLNDKHADHQLSKIEELRKALRKNNSVIEVRDFGAGSGQLKTNQRKVSDIASSSLKTKKYAQLIYRIVKYFAPQTIIELGTSLGITTSYIATAASDAKVITCEGDDSIASIAENNFKQLGITNVMILKGDFDSSFDKLISLTNHAYLVYIDGNHRKEPTLRYFSFFKKMGNDQQVMIFDDIHWSGEMEEAWEEIQRHPDVTLTIDLFFIGLVFFKKDFKVKQHFTVRF